MLKKIYGFSLLAALVSLASCSDDNPWMGNAGEGGISLKVAADGRVTDAIPVTRADQLFSIPDAEDFSILLEKIDGSYSKTFETLEDFRNEKSFPTGSYTISAFYGRMEDEGFELPYFHGSETVTVLEGRTSEVSINAAVANTLVSIDYTDDFKNYLSNYSATVHSEGHSYQEISGEKTDPVFLVPGEVAISLTFTNPQGKTATIQPTSFVAQGGHHYHVTLDVNGGNGVDEATLTVSFDRTLDKEDVVIDLSDELFDSPAPKVSPVNFEDGQLVEFLAGEALDNSYKFTIITYSGLEDVVLTINSTNFNPAFGHEVNLVGASESLQNQLKSVGIEAKGVFKVVDRMASIDISNLPKYLPAGEHEIIVIAKDKFTRTSDPVSLKINCVAPELDVRPLTALYGLNRGALSVAYNGSHPKEDISFQALNKYGSYVACPIESVEDATRTRSIETKNYIFNITLPDTEWDEIPVKVFLYGKEYCEVKLPVEMPEYQLQVDAFARKLVIKIDASDEQIPVITENLKIFNGNTAISEASIARESGSGIVTISGLNPNQDYTLSATLLRSVDSNAKSIVFTTEAAKDVDNGTFDAVTRTIDTGTIWTGGTYTGTLLSSPAYHVQSSILRDTPNGWANLNELTCFSGSSNKNTWFMVPSTYVEDGKTVIRTVGYHHAGVTPAVTRETAVYYCKNAPADLNVSAGELFLGTYSYGTQGASRSDGMAFASRPTSLSFEYSYVPVNDEKGEVYIIIYGDSNEVLSQARVYLDASSSSVTKTVALPAYPFQKKAKNIQLGFKSTASTVATPYINKPSGSALNDGVTSMGNFTRQQTVEANKYKAVAVGSVLTIDNVKLNY